MGGGSERKKSLAYASGWCGGGDLAQPEVAGWAFVIDAAGAAFGQPLIGQDLELECGDALQAGSVERQVIDIPLGDVAAGEDRAIVLDRQRRRLAFGRQWLQRLPIGCFLSLRF